MVADMITFISNQQEVREMVYARLHHLPPVGYQIDLPNWRFVVDPVLGPLVKKAWELVLGEIPVDQVLRMLNDEEFRTPRRGLLGGKPLHRKTLYNLLKDPFYTGYICADEKFCRGYHEPLVAEDGFTKVQTLLARRRRNWN